MKKIFIAMFALFLWTTVAFGSDPQPPSIPELLTDVSTYMFFTNEEIVLGWDKVAQVFITKYDVLAYNVERKAFLMRGNVPQNDNPSITLTLPRAGHYIFFVRSVNENATEDPFIYSEWVHSFLATAVKDGKKFWAYLYLASPIDLSID